MVKRKDLVLLGLLLLAALILRFLFLGYSDFQGDEIKALYRNSSAQLDFFLQQRKGPIQFLVTWALRDATGNFANRFLTRAPFALAGFLSCLFFYQFVAAVSHRRVALYASVFFVTNGLLVALARVTQYQSFVILFMVLALYFAARLVRTNRILYLYLALVAWACSMLAHYDGVFIFPLLAVLIMRWLRENGGFPVLLPRAVLPGLVFTLLAGAFYVPFALNLSAPTLSYWELRITAPASTRISSSRYLFALYQPIWALQIYTLLGSAGVALATLLLLWQAFTARLRPVATALEKTLRLDLGRLAGVHRRADAPFLLGLLLWFAVPLVLLEGIVDLPGTHIYTYLVPLTILMGLALWHAELAAGRIHRVTRYGYPIAVGLLSLFLFLQSYAIFVDYGKEYPVETKRFLLWTLPQLDLKYHTAAYGFPYSRHWAEVGRYIKEDGRSKFYWSNEKPEITEYYVPRKRDVERAGYYVYVVGRRDWAGPPEEERFQNWRAAHPPVQTFADDGAVKTSVYFLPEPAAEK